MAVVLSLGDASVLSHGSAAALWGLRPPAAGPIHATVPGESGRRRREGITIHRSVAVESTVHDGIPVTTIERTLLDLAATLPRRPLERAIDRAVERRLVDLGSVREVARPGRRGALALLDAVAA
jgi:hypothetical protein